MIKTLLITALTCLIAFATNAKQLPYWLLPEPTAKEAKAEARMKKQLLKLYKTNRDVTNQLMAAGWVLIVRNAPDLAIKRFNEAALFSPQDPAIPHGILIAGGIRKDKPDELNAAYTRALDLSAKGEHPTLHRDFGQVMLAGGHNAHALTAFRRSLKGRADPAVLICIAKLFYARGQRATARMYFDWAERVTP